MRKDPDAAAASKGTEYLAKQVSIAIQRLTEHMESASQHKPNENDVAYVIGGLEKVKTALESASSPTKTLKQVEQIPSDGDTRMFLKDMGLKEVAPHIWDFPKRTTYREAVEKSLTTSTDETDGKGGKGD